MDSVAVTTRQLGLKWDTGRVSALEKGQVSPTLPTLLVLCMALSEVTQSEVGLVDLVRFEGDVQITGKVALTGDVVARALSGERADLRRTEAEEFDQVVHEIAVRQAGGEAEQRAAQSLGLSGKRFRQLAQTLWGLPFAEERDARAGADANAQKRGRVARQLKEEMKAALEGRSLGDD